MRECVCVLQCVGVCGDDEVFVASVVGIWSRGGLRYARGGEDKPKKKFGVWDGMIRMGLLCYVKLCTRLCVYVCESVWHLVVRVSPVLRATKG